MENNGSLSTILQDIIRCNVEEIKVTLTIDNVQKKNHNLILLDKLCKL